MPPSERPALNTPHSRIRPLALWAALAVAIALALSFAAAAAAPNPIARDLQQQSAEPALPAPALTAQPAADAVELRWTEMPGAARYELWIWKNEETGWQLVSDAIAEASFTHTETTPGATCYYAVRALDDAGEPVSAWSQNVPATIPADQPQLPASSPTPISTSTPAPQHARAESTAAAPQLTAQPAAGAVELRWTELPGAARYELWTWWNEDPGWQFISDSITATDYTHTDVTPGATYYYAVRALDTAGQPLTDWSNYPSSVPLPAFTPTSTPTLTPPSDPAPAHSPTATLTPASTQPPAPTPAPTLTPTLTPTPSPAPSTLPVPDLTAQPAPGQVRLTWNEIPGAVRYELWIWKNEETGWQLVSDTLTGAAFTHTEHAHGVTCYYALRALDASGEPVSAWSQNVPATVPAASADQPQLPASTATPTLTPAFTQTPTLTLTLTPTLTQTPTSTPTTTPTHTLTPTPTPTAAPDRRLPPPPASLDLDPYYRKYLDAAGIPVVASSDVDDLHLYHARDIINAMLAHRPDLRATMAANHFRVVIYRHDGCRGPYQTPELRAELPPGRCTNIAGTATVRWLSNRYSGEVLLIIDVVATAPAVRQPYCNAILVHEFAHMVHFALAIETALAGNRPLFDSPFDARLKSAYSAAMRAGLYADAYASTNYKEYWAEAVMFWFLPDMLSGVVRTPASVTRLADYDPRIAATVQDVFRAAELPHCEPIYLRLFGKLTGPGGQPLAGITVSADLRVLNASDRSGYSSVTHSFPTGADGAYLVTINRPRLASLRTQLRQETGASDSLSYLLLAVARRPWRPASGCPDGYLAAASRQVENIAPHHAAEFPIPQSDPAPIPLQIAPTFTWTPRPAC